MLNTDIQQEDIEKLKLIVFDSDGVSVPRGTAITETIADDFIRVDAKTTFITPELTTLLKKLRERFTVAISSGRAILYLQSMYAPVLGKGTILQAENGNLSLIEGTVVQHFSYDEKYFSTLERIKNSVRALPIEGVEPKQFIVSVHAETELEGVYDVVRREDTREELKVMWNGEAFDIMHKDVSKAEGLRRLMAHLNVSREQVLAIGDRVNDVEMVRAAGIGVSADKDAVEAPYWTEGEGLPGEVLARYLVEKTDL